MLVRVDFRWGVVFPSKQNYMDYMGLTGRSQGTEEGFRLTFRGNLLSLQANHQHGADDKKGEHST